jgi:hypothetical protein
VLKRKVVPCVSNYPCAKFGEFWTFKNHYFKFQSCKDKNLEKFKKVLGPTCGSNPLAGPGQAPLWAKPTATVPIFIFLSNYSNSILIKVETSKIVGNCMDLIKY